MIVAGERSSTASSLQRASDLRGSPLCPFTPRPTGRDCRSCSSTASRRLVECWGSLASDLAADHQVIRVDAPGHGHSADVVADLTRGAELIREAGGVATYVGYSMGARFCLQLAHHDPDRVRGLVLISGTAGIDDDRERRARREQDVGTAQLIRDKGVPEFLDLWLQQPLFASLPADRAFREERLENTVEGLASSLEARRNRRARPVVAPVVSTRHASARAGGRARRQVLGPRETSG